ncbi:MAG: SUF system NifU family Fe-S cluster assembly protein [Sphaerochaeta sp.]|nr:SUF system NifU family Fe-S cluster assembly protein [Sphaerochaeta sp.]
MALELSDLYSQVIRDHNRSRHNKRTLCDPTVTVPGKNPSCGDEIVLSLTLKDGIIEDAAYTGVGCAISEASVSIMIDLIRGATVAKASELCHLFFRMIGSESLTREELEELDEAVAFSGISRMPARVKCATMAWHTLQVALQNASP